MPWRFSDAGLRHAWLPPSSRRPRNLHKFCREQVQKTTLLHYWKADKPAAPKEALAGDNLLFGAGKGPVHHCAYVTPEGGLIHCYREAGKVMEQALTDWWRAKLRHAFRLRSLQS